MRLSACYVEIATARQCLMIISKFVDHCLETGYRFRTGIRKEECGKIKHINELIH